MTDCYWSDVSEFQVGVDDSYPYRVISIRANDGTYYDHKFDHNYAWAQAAANSNRLDAILIYTVYEPNWQDTVNVLKSRIGSYRNKVVIMIDLESWGGRIIGNQSPQLNAMREQLIQFLGGDRRRVIGYGNRYDLQSLWPNFGDTKFIVASYGSVPSYPNMIGHQFADNHVVSPFGACDGNVAYGVSSRQFAANLGVGSSYNPAPTPSMPTPDGPSFSNNAVIHYVVAGDTIGKLAKKYNTTEQQLIAWNKHNYPNLTYGTSRPDYTIKVGWCLQVGASNALPNFAYNSAVHTVVRGDTLMTLAKTYRVSGGYTTLVNWNRFNYPALLSNYTLTPGMKLKVAVQNKPPKFASNSAVHVVRKGETLASIAAHYNVGGGTSALVTWNRYNYPSLMASSTIGVGWQLKVGLKGQF